MFIERFLGRRPSHFELNPIVKAYIISESFLWSAWDFVLPIISIFIANDISGGNVQTAATGYSVYLVTRVIFELISGKILQHTNDKKKVLMTIFGILFLSVGYFGFAYTSTITLLFISYSMLGIGLGIASPAKNALFAIHLDKNKESTEWSLNDAVSFICMALATALGGFVAAAYGFQVVFILAGVVNLISLLPYFLFVYKPNQ